MSENKYTTNNNPTLAAVSNADGETPVYLLADMTTGRLLTDTTITSSVGSNAVAFVTTVTTAGVRVQLASNVLSNGIIIQAPSTNTGIIYVGDATVSATVYGAELQPGQSTSFAGSNTNLIYVDTSVSASKVSVLGN